MDGELFLEQSSELEEEVEVGVMGTVLLLAERIKHKKGQSVVQMVAKNKTTALTNISMFF